MGFGVAESQLCPSQPDDLRQGMCSLKLFSPVKRRENTSSIGL